jgi:hypothetical protein
MGGGGGILNPGSFVGGFYVQNKVYMVEPLSKADTGLTGIS